MPDGSFALSGLRRIRLISPTAALLYQASKVVQDEVRLHYTTFALASLTLRRLTERPLPRE